MEFNFIIICQKHIMQSEFRVEISKLLKQKTYYSANEYLDDILDLLANDLLLKF